MAKFFKFLLLLLIVGSVVWLAAMWRWHSQRANPDGMELLVYLLVLPIALTVGLVVCAWQINKIALYAMSPLPVPQPATAVTNPSEGQGGVEGGGAVGGDG